MTKDQIRILELEKQLAEANNTIDSLSAIYEYSSEAVMLHDNGVAISVNQASLSLLGYNREEVLGTNMVYLVALEAYHDEIFRHFREAKNLDPVFFEGRKKDGSSIFIETKNRLVTVGGRKVFMCNFRDVTKSLEKENELVRLSSHFSAIFNNDEFSVAIIDAQKNKYLDINDRFCELMGYSKDELLQLKPTDVSGEDGYDSNRLMELKSARYSRTLTTKSGKKIYGKINMCYFSYEGLDLYYSIFVDTTKEVLQRREIDEKQHFLETLLIKSEVASWDYNTVTGEIFCSDNLATILGYEKGEIPTAIGPFSMLFYEEDQIPLDKLGQDYFHGEMDSFSIDIRMLNKQGQAHWIRVTSIDIVADDDGKPQRMQGIYIDINSYKIKEKKLQVSEEQYRLLFMNISAGFSLHELVRNEQGEIIDSCCIQANKAFEAVLDTKDLIVQGNYLSKAYPELLEQWLGIFKQVVDQGESISFVEHYPENDKHFEINVYSPQKDQVALLINDISIRIRQEQKIKANHRYLEEKNQELQIKNNELEIISVEILEGRATYNKIIHDIDPIIDNQTGTSIYGRWEYLLDTDRFIGSKGIRDIYEYDNKFDKLTFERLLTLINPEDVDVMKNEFLSSLKSGTVCKQEYSIIVNGKKKFLLSQAVPHFTKEGKFYKFVGTLLDITERKLIEKKLRRQNDHYLKQNEELIVAREKAKESEKLKTAFFANMSHEIRTPMNGILGFSGLLLEPEVSDSERIEYSQFIANSGKRLLSIVNDILDISKLESGNVGIVKSDLHLNNLLNDLFRLFEQDNKTKNTNVKLSLHRGLNDVQSVFVTDGTRLSQILSNLLSNAIKFTKSGEVSFGYSLRDEELFFYVKDSGLGIPQDMQEKIFEPFKQVENKLVRQYGGTGLGLSISRKLCRMMGGDMSLKSVVGQGSVFTFTLPYTRGVEDKKSLNKPKVENTIDQGEHQPCILIAEDERVNFMFFQSFLGKKMHILHAENGLEAVEMVEEHPEIDVVLMDLKMPLMSGLEATKKIKKKHPNLPIIAQTAYAMSEDREQCYAAGCDDYITKPINRRKLLEMLKGYCS